MSPLDIVETATTAARFGAAGRTICSIWRWQLSHKGFGFRYGFCWCCDPGDVHAPDADVSVPRIAS